MIGYHYTTEGAWASIQRTGLEPRLLNDDKIASIESIAGLSPRWKRAGIWVWCDRLRPMAHAGSLFWILSKHGQVRVALLSVEFSAAARLTTADGWDIDMRHTGDAGRWAYHDPAIEKAWILIEPIPPPQLRLVRLYDVVEMLSAE